MSNEIIIEEVDYEGLSNLEKAAIPKAAGNIKKFLSVSFPSHIGGDQVVYAVNPTHSHLIKLVRYLSYVIEEILENVGNLEIELTTFIDSVLVNQTNEDLEHIQLLLEEVSNVISLQEYLKEVKELEQEEPPRSGEGQEASLKLTPEERDDTENDGRRYF